MIGTQSPLLKARKRSRYEVGLISDWPALRSSQDLWIRFPTDLRGAS